VVLTAFCEMGNVSGIVGDCIWVGRGEVYLYILAGPEIFKKI